MDNRQLRRSALGAVSVIGVVLGLTAVVGIASIASAEELADCDNPTTTVVDRAAYNEITTVVDEAAWTETIPAVASQWWNWSPNEQGPFVGTPTFPNDARGTWVGPHTEGGPDGTGTYQLGGGHGPWFHRVAGTPELVVEHEAKTREEVTTHAAETHEEPNPAYPCPDEGIKEPVPEETEGPVVTKPQKPTEPQKPTRPTTVTINTPDKMVKVTKDAEGNTIDREVTRYEGVLIEEGF